MCEALDITKLGLNGRSPIDKVVTKWVYWTGWAISLVMLLS